MSQDVNLTDFLEKSKFLKKCGEFFIFPLSPPTTFLFYTFLSVQSVSEGEGLSTISRTTKPFENARETDQFS